MQPQLLSWLTVALLLGEVIQNFRTWVIKSQMIPERQELGFCHYADTLRLLHSPVTLQSCVLFSSKSHDTDMAMSLTVSFFPQQIENQTGIGISIIE